MQNKERFINTMEYKEVDHVPNWELAVWGQTAERWEKEGLDPDKVHWDWFKGEEYFDMDYREFVDIKAGMIPPYDEKVIEENERHMVYQDTQGRIRKALKEGQTRGTRLSMDQYLDFPVKNKEDFAKVKERYQPLIEERYPDNWREKITGWNNRNHVLIPGKNCSFNGFYWNARDWMGTEHLSFAWYDQPDLMHDMMEFFADFVIEVLEPMVTEVDFDYFNFNEDMAMKSGPLLSPATFKEFIFPHLKRVITFLKSNGVRYISVDTDGNSDRLIPLLMEAGVDIVWPLERAADMDPVKLREKYGKDLLLWGGVDKRILAEDKEDIKKHLEELAPLVEEGGFIPTVDHAVQPGVSLENFEYYMDVKKKILGM